MEIQKWWREKPWCYSLPKRGDARYALMRVLLPRFYVAIIMGVQHVKEDRRVKVMGSHL